MKTKTILRKKTTTATAPATTATAPATTATAPATTATAPATAPTTLQYVTIDGIDGLISVPVTTALQYATHLIGGKIPVTDVPVSLRVAVVGHVKELSLLRAAADKAAAVAEKEEKESLDLLEATLADLKAGTARTPTDAYKLAVTCGVVIGGKVTASQGVVIDLICKSLGLDDPRMTKGTAPIICKVVDQMIGLYKTCGQWPLAMVAKGSGDHTPATLAKRVTSHYGGRTPTHKAYDLWRI